MVSQQYIGCKRTLKSSNIGSGSTKFLYPRLPEAHIGGLIMSKIPYLTIVVILSRKTQVCKPNNDKRLQTSILDYPELIRFSDVKCCGYLRSN